MALPTFSNALLAILAMLLLIAAFIDLRERRIPNKLTLAIALLAVPFWVAGGLPLWPGIALQIGAAALLFALFAALFALGMMGGGDVKLIAALALWLPWRETASWLSVMALAGALLTVVMMAFEYARRGSWRPEVPYGVAIASAGLWAVAVRYINQFG